MYAFINFRIAGNKASCFFEKIKIKSLRLTSTRVIDRQSSTSNFFKYITTTLGLRLSKNYLVLYENYINLSKYQILLIEQNQNSIIIRIPAIIAIK